MTDPIPPTPSRRQLARRARDAFPAMGVFAIRNHATGRVSVKASRNVPGAINRLTFELRQGCHRDRSLQALWHARGAEGVTMDVLELVRERQDPAFDYDAELALLEALYRQELSPEVAP
jgi:isopenicillin N synthase-like dioxygenase